MEKRNQKTVNPEQEQTDKSNSEKETFEKKQSCKGNI